MVMENNLPENSNKVFIYWDNSNIFIECQRITEEKDYSPDSRLRVRIHFENLLRLAHGGRDIEKAIAAGSVPPEMNIYGIGWKI